MKLEYVPMLAVQRDLYRIERGSGRFHQYLQTMLDPETGELRLPLTMMNPMAKEHLPKYLDLLQAIGAEEVGARAMEDALAKLGEEPGHYRVGIVVADDAGGGWTHRAASELMHLQAELGLEKRGWIKGQWIEKSGQRRRRYYRLTPVGRKVLDAQRTGWKAFVAAINRIAGLEHA